MHVSWFLTVGFVHSIEYWFRCLDLDGDGALSLFEMDYFYQEVQQRLRELNIDCLSVENTMCQILDMINPMEKGRLHLLFLVLLVGGGGGCESCGVHVVLGEGVWLEEEGGCEIVVYWQRVVGEEVHFIARGLNAKSVIIFQTR